MAGWEQSCCALASLELSGRVCGLLHYPGLPPMGSGSDTDARGTWASRFASLGLSVLICKRGHNDSTHTWERKQHMQRP